MEPPILLTGGTGTLGRRLLPRLQATGGAVRVLSRRPHPDEAGVEFVVGDLATGAGVAAAVEGVQTVVHCAGGPHADDEKARHLVSACIPAGVRHVVFVSVVGVDRIPGQAGVDRVLFGFYAAKLAAERMLAESGLPWTTLRATQFHDLIYRLVRPLGRLPVVPVLAGVRFQPIETDEVAARLAELALGPPAGRVPDLAGPRVYLMAELARSYLRATDRRRTLLPIRLPGAGFRALRAGANLAPDRAVGRRTWEEYLADQLSTAA